MSDPAQAPSSAPQSVTRDLTGQVLASRYQLLDVVGGGGMGTVYRANDAQLQRQVAVKVLDPRFDPGKDPAYRERFLREARLSTRLSHGNIVEVFDTGESDGVHFIAMELLTGRTLAQLLEVERVLAWERVLKLIRQMCAGLAFAHELGLVHRDLKPANCFVLGEGPTEWVKLLDFGLAKPMVNSPGESEEVTRTSVVVGSPTYMAPEQARGEASVETDIYAIGVMLYRMLSGQVPFVGRTAIDVIVNHIQTPLPWLEEVTSGHSVPIELELVMRRCLEKDPKARYPSVQTLVDALDSAELDTRRDPAKRAVTIQMAAARRATPMSRVNPVPPPPSIPPVVMAPAEPLFASARPASTSSGSSPLWKVAFALGLVGVGVAAGSLLLKPPDGAAPVAGPSTPATAVAPSPAPAGEGAVTGGVVNPTPSTATEEAHGPVTFRINSIPTGATVKVGSRVMGVTPAIFKVDPDDTGEATAELTLELHGYQTITFIATSPGPRFDLTQRLQKGAGKVQLPRQASAAPAPAAKDDEPIVPVTIPVVKSMSVGKERPNTKDLVPAHAPETPVGAALAAAVAAPPTAAPAPVPAPAVPPQVAAGEVVPADLLTSRAKLVEGGQPLTLSEAAKAAKVEAGSAVVRCVVNAQGRLEGCRMVKPIAQMEGAILESLKTRVYEPAKVGATAVKSELNVVVKVVP